MLREQAQKLQDVLKIIQVYKLTHAKNGRPRYVGSLQRVQLSGGNDDQGSRENVPISLSIKNKIHVCWQVSKNDQSRQRCKDCKNVKIIAKRCKELYLLFSPWLKSADLPMTMMMIPFATLMTTKTSPLTREAEERLLGPQKCRS